MSKFGNRSRFGGIDARSSSAWEEEKIESAAPRPAAGDDPWNKLASGFAPGELERLRNGPKMCPRCHTKMEYISLGEYKCPECRLIERDGYGKVRAYIDEHGPSGAQEIEEATGVPRETVDELLREGKLEIVNGPSGYLRCELCGAEIRYGRICEKCARTDGAKAKGYFVGDAGESPYTPKDAGEMRFLKKRKERIDSGFKKMGRR